MTDDERSRIWLDARSHLDALVQRLDREMDDKTLAWLQGRLAKLRRDVQEREGAR